MQFDPENNINKLCAYGMQLEGEGKPEQALETFYEAWNKATNNIEKLTAAHYVARHQKDTTNKLEWDNTALDLATAIDSKEIKGLYPSLYLNVAKCYEELGNFNKAIENYLLALDFVAYLPADGYGNMIRSGIDAGIERVRKV